MAKKKKIVRRAWTATEVRELKSLAKRRSGVARIAKALKRTIAATAVKASQLGVSLASKVAVFRVYRWCRLPTQWSSIAGFQC
jgi:hypothetical protein